MASRHLSCRRGPPCSALPRRGRPPSWLRLRTAPGGRGTSRGRAPHPLPGPDRGQYWRSALPQALPLPKRPRSGSGRFCVPGTAGPGQLFPSGTRRGPRSCSPQSRGCLAHPRLLWGLTRRGRADGRREGAGFSWEKFSPSPGGGSSTRTQQTGKSFVPYIMTWRNGPQATRQGPGPSGMEWPRCHLWPRPLGDPNPKH